MKLTLGFSPCPNDTFIFDALVNGKIDTEGLSFEVMLEDVQTLNRWALNEKLDISKISYGVLPLVFQKYIVLHAGGALGKGVGPLLITRKETLESGKQKFDPAQMSVAIPGEHTTAHLLFNTAFPTARKKHFMLFSAIEEAVLAGTVDAGVIIHENRFTYMNKGLEMLMDLGKFWEEQTSYPIPLGGVIMRRSFPPAVSGKVNRLIQGSVAYAFECYPSLPEYVKQHAQEMEEEVMRKHIDLYVNNFSLSLGEDGKAAVMKMIGVFNKPNAEKLNEKDVFIS